MAAVYTSYIILDNDCSIRVCQSHVAIYQKIISYYAGIMLIMLSVTYYAQNYAGIISWSLKGDERVLWCQPRCLFVQWSREY